MTLHCEFLGNNPRSKAERFIRLMEGFYDSLEDDYYRVREDVQDEWLSGKRHQSWTLVPKAKLVRLYQENGKYGRINENILLDIWGILHDAAIKVIINSETKDHDSWPYDIEPDLRKPVKAQKADTSQGEFGFNDPRKEIEQEEIEGDELEKRKDREWSRWFLFVSDLSNSRSIRNFGEVKGNARYSDQSNRLTTLLRAAYSAKELGEKLMAIDRILNFAHGLGNMAKWFVEGGVSTLDQIADFAPKGITAGGLR